MCSPKKNALVFRPRTDVFSVMAERRIFEKLDLVTRIAHFALVQARPQISLTIFFFFFFEVAFVASQLLRGLLLMLGFILQTLGSCHDDALFTLYIQPAHLKL